MHVSRYFLRRGCKSAIDYGCLRAGAALERVVVSWPYNPDQVVDSVEAALSTLGSWVTYV
jgi:hypothetical protein